MKTQSNKNHNQYLLLFAILIFALLVFQLYFIVTLRRESQAILKNQAMIGLRQVEDAFGASDPTIDAASKRLYLSGVGLYLPLSVDALDIKYRITDAGDTTDIVFQSKANGNSFMYEGADEQCFDLVRVEIGSSEASPRSRESMTEPFRLNDGRAVHVYLPGKTAECKNSMLVTSEKVEPIIRQLQSY